MSGISLGEDDAQAIAYVITQAMTSQGIVASAAAKPGYLWIILDGILTPQKEYAVNEVSNILLRMGFRNLGQVTIYGRKVGETLPDWSYQFDYYEYQFSNSRVVENNIRHTQNNNIVACPRCASENLNVTEQGYSLGKAAIGVLLFGTPGLLGGFVGSEDIYIECLTCGYRWQFEQAPIAQTMQEREPVRRYTDAKIEKHTASGCGAIGCSVSLLAMGMIFALNAALQWTLSPLFLFLGVFIFISSLASEGQTVSLLVGLCPYCKTRISASLSEKDMRCNNCSKRIAILGQRFYTIN